jgi:integrase
MLDLEKIYKNIANNFELIRKYESLSKHEFSQQLSISSGNYGDVVGEPPRINASLKMIIGLLNAYPAVVSHIKEPASQYKTFSEWETLHTRINAMPPEKRQYFPPGTPFPAVQTFAATIQAEKLQTRLNNNPAGIILSPVHAPTLAELAALYQTRRAHEIDTTRAAFAMLSLTKYLSPELPINHITQHHLHQYRDALLQTRLATIDQTNHARVQKTRRGVNKELHELRVIFNWAYRQVLVSYRVFDKVTFYHADQNQPETLTRAEEKLFYKALPKNDLRLAYYILRFTGIRRGELMRLTFGDIDLQNRLITLQQTKNRTAGETVPIHPKLKRILTWLKFSSYPPGDLIFPYNLSWVTRGFYTALKNARLHKHSAAHLIRHTFGRRVIESNQSDFDNGQRLAQELLRHKEAGMIRHYTKIVKVYLIEEHSKLNL